MKSKIWLVQLAIVLVFTVSFEIAERGTEGRLTNPFLREQFFPATRRMTGLFTDLKYRIRGVQDPKHKIVIVAVDDDSLKERGRWPWHRNEIAVLIDKIFNAGAKVVGTDIVFSEPDQRVPDEMVEVLKKNNLSSLLEGVETDPYLAEVIHQYRNKLVLGWFATTCQPAFLSSDEFCPIHDNLPPKYDRFAMSFFEPAASGFDVDHTPMVVAFQANAANIPLFSDPAKHIGFLNVEPDVDGVIRHSQLVFIHENQAYPSLPLEMARVGLDEQLRVQFDKDYGIDRLSFSKSGNKIPVNRLGVTSFNFRGPGKKFPYVSALKVLQDDIQDQTPRKPANADGEPSLQEAFKDAYVLIGVSALGVFDMRNFPFDNNVAGVEGQATMLDNLLSNDLISQAATGTGHAVMLMLMILGAIVFGLATLKFEAVPALLLGVLAFGGFGYIDTKLLFARAQDWNTGFIYLEMGTIFLFTLAAKYVVEEKNKKFIRSAFTKYVAPTIVDSIMKDPTKLSLGGERKDLTILFSDIRGFTTFSEKLDAKALSMFLNDYLGIMTKIVFAHDGTLDKYIGDAVMAFWGAPLDQPIHASNATKAAIAMIKALNENRERFLKTYGIEVDIGIGINTGAVSVGNMGSDTNFEYTVIGDHVNLASRLEGLTKAYAAKIVTTRFTLDSIQASGCPIPEHRVIDFVKVKGKHVAVELVQLLPDGISKQNAELFEEGRTLYKAQKWQEAIAKFKAAIEAAGPAGDGTAEVYIERCIEFEKSPPGPDWVGSWEMRTK